ncbi:cytochrome P450 [Streptomyces sp. GS7]|uniref:cytochrome P450 n=1 Tax=Streptomyces sp. GS7 TaxID=2692234 RepID=UPI0013195BAB|nr:cytochrome P450 [Streptomyces sp. GS7]QHC20455.1 cytochrome P450 [Streptomyces sp. GS7]
MTETLPVPGAQPRGCPFDPPDDYRRVQQDGDPVVVTLQHGRQGRLLTRYKDVRKALKDGHFSSSLHVLPPVIDGQSPPGWIFGMDPPEHTRYRRLLADMFSVRRMRRFEPRVERIVGERLEEIRGRGGPADLMKDFAWPISARVSCDLLGTTLDDQERFERQVGRLVGADVTPEVFVATYQEMWFHMLDLVRAKRTQPGDDVLSELLAAEDERGPLSDEEAASIGLQLRIAGKDLVAHAIGLGIFVLLRTPDQLDLLRKDPELVDNAVDELLRYLPINNMGSVRKATEDAAAGDQQIAGGEVIVASLTAANRDERTFPDADRLDLTRRNAVQHVAFGHGAHRCLGQHQARLMIAVSLRELLRHFPELRLAVAAEQVPPYEDMAFYGVAELPVTW